MQFTKGFMAALDRMEAACNALVQYEEYRQANQVSGRRHSHKKSISPEMATLHQDLGDSLSNSSPASSSRSHSFKGFFRRRSSSARSINSSTDDLTSESSSSSKTSSFFGRIKSSLTGSRHNTQAADPEATNAHKLQRAVSALKNSQNVTEFLDTFCEFKNAFQLVKNAYDTQIYEELPVRRRVFTIENDRPEFNYIIEKPKGPISQESDYVAMCEVISAYCKVVDNFSSQMVAFDADGLVNSIQSQEADIIQQNLIPKCTHSLMLNKYYQLHGPPTPDTPVSDNLSQSDDDSDCAKTPTP